MEHKSAQNYILVTENDTHLLQTIAVVPIQAFGVAQFGSMQKVSTLVFESNFHMILKEKAIPMIMASLFRLLEQFLNKFA